MRGLLKTTVLSSSLTLVAGCGQGLLNYDSVVLQGQPPRYEVTLDEPSGGKPIPGATVTLVHDSKPHSACSLRDNRNKNIALTSLVTDSRGEVRETYSIPGSIFWTNYLNVCVEADGFAPYEYTINLNRERLGIRNVRKIQVIYLAPAAETTPVATKDEGL